MAKKEEQDVIQMLMDEANTDNLVLLDPDQKEVEFEQVAVIPLDNKIYAILKPVKEMEGVGEDEALVFVIETINGQDCLVVENNDAKIDAVFDEYYSLLKADGVDIDTDNDSDKN